MPIQEETLGPTKNMLERLSGLAWECLDVPLEELVEVGRERTVWIFRLRLFPTWTGRSGQKRNKTNI